MFGIIISIWFSLKLFIQSPDTKNNLPLKLIRFSRLLSTLLRFLAGISSNESVSSAGIAVGSLSFLTLLAPFTVSFGNLPFCVGGLEPASDDA